MIASLTAGIIPGLSAGFSPGPMRNFQFALKLKF